MPEQDEDHQRPDDAEVPLCPHCLEENRPAAHFCEKCGRPLTSYSAIAPLESVFARGWAFRRAVGGPTRPIIFWGMWILLAPSMFLLAAVGLGALAGGNLIGALIAFGLLYLFFEMGWKMTAKYLSQWREPQGSDVGSSAMAEGGCPSRPDDSATTGADQS